MEDIETFATREEAIEVMCDRLDDPCIDNIRFAYLDDVEGMHSYEEAREHGCCGSSDTCVRIGDRLAMVGCNYGH